MATPHHRHLTSRATKACSVPEPVVSSRSRSIRPCTSHCSSAVLVIAVASVDSTTRTPHEIASARSAFMALAGWAVAQLGKNTAPHNAGLRDGSRALNCLG